MGHSYKCFTRSILFFICISFLWILQPAISYAQKTNLLPGDAAFTGFNSDEEDDFSIVFFSDISADTKVHFSSEEWNGSAFSGSGGHLTWVAPPGGVSAGRVVVFNNVGGEPVANIGSIIDDSNIDLSGAGDVIYAYLGPDQDTPNTFLGAIATAGDEYNQPDGTEGTLVNTNLTQGSSAILLSNHIDAAQYTGDRSGNTKNGYLKLLNEVTTQEAKDDNWDQFGGSGDQAGQILPFNTQDFKIVPAPTVAFTTDAQSVTEGNSITLTVKLVDATNANVDVDVDFLDENGSASAGDINEQTSTTVHFTNASTGDAQTISITPAANDGFEGREKAVFQLRNNTGGSIIKPATQTLTIIDSQTPQVVINEILYDPADAGDANGDGTADGTEDEFVEFVNTSNHDLDISNWTVSDANSVKYTFKRGTVIPADGAFVVFAKAAEGTGFGPAYLYEAESLGLNNSGDTVKLADDEGNIIATYAYSGSQSNQSITRSPDINGNFTGHKAADTDDQSPSSPGTKIDGSAFGSATYAISIRGTVGYRFVAAPTQGTTFSNLFANVWSQGIPDSDAPSAEEPNIFNWAESGGGLFSAIGDMKNQLQPGKGYIIYVFADDNFRAPGIQGGFPKIISSSNRENGAVDVAVSSGDADNNGSIDGNEGYNLLGNPYGTDISVDAVLAALEAAAPNATVNQNIYIWNNDQPGGADYETLSSGDTIAPFQAFFVRYTTGGVSATINFNRNDLAANKGAVFYEQASAEDARFSVSLGKGDQFNTYEVEFKTDGKVGEDKYDAYKLFSLDAHTIRLFSRVGQGVELAKNVLPPVDQLKSELRIPMGYAVPTSGKYTFSWSDLINIPENMELYLVDTKTNQKINMRTSENYSFNAVVDQPQQQPGEKERRLVQPKANEEIRDVNGRFELLAVPASANEKPEEPVQESVSLGPNYPNPFSNHTTLNLTLKESMHVEMTIYNIVGQRVRTIADKMMAKGEHPMMWDVPGNMPSGIYICKVEAGGKVLTRKMTLVK